MVVTYSLMSIFSDVTGDIRDMMYLEIFDRGFVSRSPVRGVVKPPTLDYLKRLYTYNVDSIENYYQSRNFAVRNTHILSRLVELIPIDLTLDDQAYISKVERNLTYLGKHFRFTSPLERGLVHPGYMFGNDSEEVIFSIDEPFNIDHVKRNWKSAKCVTVFKSPRNDTRLLLPLGRDDGSRGGIASVGVNIPILAIKYREFIREQRLLESPLTKNHFVIKYVLDTMGEDMVDHMFLNKIMDKYYGREEVTPNHRLRFKIFEPTNRLNIYVDEILNTITTKNLDFLDILHQIPLCFSTDAAELLALPDLSNTKQVRWGVYVSRLEYMIFLYDVSKNRSRSQHYINDWKRLTKRIRRDNLIEGMFSYETEKYILELMDRIDQM